MKDNEKHWSSELITIFGMWLWEQGYHGHALLCITGPAWGMKIGHQLKLTWRMFVPELQPITPVLKGATKDGIKRGITGVIKEYLELAKAERDENSTDRVYVNTKTGKPLTTSTLNREFETLSTKFLNEMKERFGVPLNLKPFKTNALEIAWALDNVERYYFSKKSFIAVSKHMGHRTLKDTINLLDVEPLDDIHLDFTGGNYLRQLKSSDLKNDQILMHYVGYALGI
jgi:hypothetical protein